MIKLITIISIVSLSLFFDNKSDITIKKIEWLPSPQETIAQGVFNNDESRVHHFKYMENKTKYYLTASGVTTSNLNFDIILAVVESYRSPHYEPYYFYRFIKINNYFIFLDQYSDPIKINYFSKNHLVINANKNLQIYFKDYLYIPPKIKIGNSNLFSHRIKPNVFFQNKNVYPVEIEKGDFFNLNGKLFLPKNKNEWEKIKDNRGNSEKYTFQQVVEAGAFILKLADGTIALYSLTIPFEDNNGNGCNPPLINWKIDMPFTEFYHDDIGPYNRYILSYRDVVYDNIRIGKNNYEYIPFSDNDLEIIGFINFDNSPVYSFKDKNHPVLKAIYNRENSSSHKKTYSYDEYIKRLPLFFWKDPWGRMMLFRNERFYRPYLSVGVTCAEMDEFEKGNY